MIHFFLNNATRIGLRDRRRGEGELDVVMRYVPSIIEKKIKVNTIVLYLENV